MARGEEETEPRADLVPGAPHPSETAALYGHAGAEAALLEGWGAGRLHHAWLIRGTQGIGKATLAYRFARALIACGDAVPGTLALDPGHLVARRVATGSEPQLHILRRRPNEKTGRLRTQIVIDDVRGLRGFLNLSAPDGGWRAVIVDAADEMNGAAANALLKMLEEPPARTVLLLISHAAGGLLPTIRSRCRALDLQPLGPDDLAAALDGAGLGIAAAEAKALAQLSGGSAGRAIQLTRNGGLALYARLTGLLSGGRIDRGGMTALAEDMTGAEGQAKLAFAGDLLLSLIGRIARAGATGTPLPDAAPGEGDLARRLAPDTAAARAWAEASARIAARLAQARAVNLDPAQTMLDTFLDLDMLVSGASSR